MGLLDTVINSVTHSQSQPAAKGGMSPLVKALLLLLAAKAVSSHFGKDKSPASPSAAGEIPAPPSGKIESGILAGLPSLDSLLDRFRSHGHDETVKSWVGPGANKPIAPQDLGSALGPDTVSQLERESGLPRDQLLGQLSQALPQVVDKLTPDGRLPPPQERGHW